MSRRVLQIDLRVRKQPANEIGPEPADAARAMERAVSGRAPGGAKRERSGRLGGRTLRSVRRRATGCAARAQAGEGGQGRNVHGVDGSCRKRIRW
ncbi:hypothetical protein BN2475_180047 [Paraburkholderia ribeironis]|uniref:Uncharacterized protein n=1 Tax=Paraburkholderia ribeironis TaxID=1247936 RepID=A0A1N7RV02_9BURK|nr:hypothetical protein BN2475_180047 [Paraburkholderia ribeironis]